MTLYAVYLYCPAFSVSFSLGILSQSESVTGEDSSKGAREGTHRPFPNYNITGPPITLISAFNVSARSDARQPTDCDSSVARCTKNWLIITAVVAAVTATAVAAAAAAAASF